MENDPHRRLPLAIQRLASALDGTDAKAVLAALDEVNTEAHRLGIIPRQRFHSVLGCGYIFLTLAVDRATKRVTLDNGSSYQIGQELSGCYYRDLTAWDPQGDGLPLINQEFVVFDRDAEDQRLHKEYALDSERYRKGRDVFL